MISGLRAVHDFQNFRVLFSKSDEDRAKLRRMEEMFPNPSHPVVRTHPVSGRKAIFVNPQFTLFIKGMEEQESKTLLGTLFGLTQRLEHQYRHRWSPNQVVFWDNRSVQHAAVHDYYPQRRRMDRVTIAGDARPAGDALPPGAGEIRKFKHPPATEFSQGRARRQFEKVEGQ